MTFSTVIAGVIDEVEHNKYVQDVEALVKKYEPYVQSFFHTAPNMVRQLKDVVTGTPATPETTAAPVSTPAPAPTAPSPTAAAPGTPSVDPENPLAEVGPPVGATVEASDDPNTTSVAAAPGSVSGQPTADEAAAINSRIDGIESTQQQILNLLQSMTGSASAATTTPSA